MVVIDTLLHNHLHRTGTFAGSGLNTPMFLIAMPLAAAPTSSGAWPSGSMLARSTLPGRTKGSSSWHDRLDG